MHVSTTYIRDPDNQYRTGYIYGRPDNATVRQTEAVIAALEGAHEAMLFGSGMAAATGVVLALPPGSHVVAPQVCYWGLRDWLINEAPLFGYKVDLADMTQPRCDARRREARHEARLDRDAVQSAVGHHRHRGCRRDRARGRRQCSAINSTAATPVFTRPLSLGADIVMHSATKYLNGHSDVIAGALAAARDAALWTRIRQVRGHHGAIIGPFEAWLLLRGLRTLDVRVQARRRKRRRCSQRALPITQAFPPCSIPDCPRIRATRSRRGRCPASAACCRSG